MRERVSRIKNVNVEFVPFADEVGGSAGVGCRRIYWQNSHGSPDAESAVACVNSDQRSHLATKTADILGHRGVGRILIGPGSGTLF